MKIDLLGRIHNTQLPTTKVLLPLFEAIVNSIYAIEESKKIDGRIEVYLTREDVLQFSGEEEIRRNIIGFTVVDNGIGFNEENFKSFQTSDSTVKMNRGAKGIGRLLWLKAFEYVKVTSIFCEDKTYNKRTFEFRPTSDGIINDSLEEIAASNVRTIVELKNINKKYADYLPRSADVIADKIIEHCLSYLLLSSCPQIILIDNGEPEISINKVFKEGTSEDTDIETIQIGSHDFTITSLNLYSGDDTKHKVHLCANSREVINENLGSTIIDLGKKLIDDDGRSFVFHAYVSSPYLDSIVNPERTGFNFKQEDDNVINDELRKSEINADIMLYVRKKLNKYLVDLKDKKKENLTDFIYTEAPQYRHLLKYEDRLLEEIPYGLSNDKLDLELHKISAKIEQQVREKGLKIINYDIQDPNDYEKYETDFVNYIEEVNDIGKSKLALYVIHRKLILELLSNRLKKGDTGNYKLEDSIHEIIFPLRTTSDDVAFTQQNLWIIDEKLSFHRYLASDKQIRSMAPFSSNSQKRPDLLIIYDTPFMFVDSDAPFNSIIIIEFKRPMRTNLSGETEDPIKQVYTYIRKITQNEEKTHDGRPININDGTRFYCYVIADLSKELHEVCKDKGLTISPDNLGYFGYNPNHKAYIEVISYDKLILDARKRNSVLFDQLGLPR